MKVAQQVPLASVVMPSNSPRSRMQGRLQIAIPLPLTQQKGPVSRAFLGGRTWDRNRPSANPLGETEADSSPSLQRKSSSPQDDGDPSRTAAFHPAFGQQVDSEESDAPLGSA